MRRLVEAGCRPLARVTAEDGAEEVALSSPAGATFLLRFLCRDDFSSFPPDPSGVFDVSLNVTTDRVTWSNGAPVGSDLAELTSTLLKLTRRVGC